MSRICCLLAALLLSVCLFELRAEPAPQLRFQHVSSMNGLNQNSITSLYQDKAGILWIGTQDGLHSYNGIEFTLFQHDPYHSQTLSDNHVTDILQDSRGQLWIGTFNGGLNRLDLQTGVFTPVGRDKGINSKRINRLTLVGETLWVGSGNGLYALDTVSGELHELSLGQNISADIRVLTPIGKDALLIGTQSDGLLVLRNEGLKPLPLPDAEHGHPVQARQSEDGALWLVIDDALWRYPPGLKNPEFIYRLPTPNRGILEFIFDSRGGIWLGGQQTGLIQLQLKEGQWQARHYRYDPSDPNSLSDNDVYSLLQDNNGILWIGSLFSGIDKVNLARQYFEHIYNNQQPLERQRDNNIRAIFRSGDGLLYLGTDRAGLFHMDQDGRFFSHNSQLAKLLGQDESFLDLTIRAITEDSSRRLWLASSEGLIRLNKSGQMQLYRPPGNEPGIRDLIISPDEQIWLGAGNTLYHFDPDTGVFQAHFVNEYLEEGPQSQMILSLTTANNGIWVGTTNGAYWLQPDTGQQQIIRGDRLANPMVRDILRDRDGNIWFATHGGLSRLRQDELQHFGRNQGLPGNTVYAMEQDKSGDLWLSSNSGISRFAIDKEKVLTFNEYEGLQALEFNGNVSWQDKDGSIWFGGINGLNHFYPQQVPKVRKQPKLALAGYRLGNSYFPRLDLGHIPELTIPYSEQLISFEITALDFAYPQRHRFSFFLEGWDKSWHPAQSLHEISYTNLAPGDYRLFARHQLQHNPEGHEQLLLKLTVPAPFYRTTLANLFYLALALLLFGLWLRRFLSQRRLEQQTQSNIQLSEERLKLALWGSGDRMWDWQLKDDRFFVTGPKQGSEAPLETNASRQMALVHPDDRPHVQAALESYLQGDAEFFEAEYRIKLGNTHWGWVLDRGKIVERDRSGKPLRLAGTYTDISMRRGQEEALRLSSQVLESMNESVVVCDLNYRIISVNPAFCSTTGFNEQKISGKSFLFLTRGLYARSFYQQIEHQLLNQKHWSGEVQIRTHSKQPLLVWMEVNQVLNSQGEASHFVVVFTDITDRKQAEEDLRLLANYDQLTGLPNRTLFQDRLDHALRQAHRNRNMVALLFLDLDRFKHINDSLGHHVGDQLLKAVSSRLTQAIRDGDTVARLGGDEFIIILEGLQKTKAATVIAEKLLAAFERPFALENFSLNVSPSIGISLYPDDAEEALELLKFADTAMYHAKSLGRNNFQFYTAKLNAYAVRHVQLEAGLKQALDRDEFYLLYQPKFCVHTGKLTGMEALLRWESQDLGPISPAEFIPLAEETGLVNAIGQWVLLSVCSQLERWQNQGLEAVPIAINISAKQLQTDIISSIEVALAMHGLAADLLEIELTESAVMQQPLESVEILNQLKGLGLSLAVDDFGTGYSSLAYLKRFPLNTLKIDREFVRDITKDPDDAAITSAIIVLAHSLELQVVAEGVETQAQLNFLAAQGCDQAQGFLLGRPMTEAQAQALLGRK